MQISREGGVELGELLRGERLEPGVLALRTAIQLGFRDFEGELHCPEDADSAGQAPAEASLPRVGGLALLIAENSYLVPYTMTRVGADCEIYPPDGTWADPDTVVAATILGRILRARAEGPTR